jgi:hypothetical protein
VLFRWHPAFSFEIGATHHVEDYRQARGGLSTINSTVMVAHMHRDVRDTHRASAHIDSRAKTKAAAPLEGGRLSRFCVHSKVFAKKGGLLAESGEPAQGTSQIRS